MAYERSLFDIYTESLSELERLKVNLGNDLMGTQVEVLRLTPIQSPDALPGRTSDVFGYSEITLDSWQPQTISNVVIRYPRDFMEIFQTRDANTSSSVGFDIIDLFPIEMFLSAESIITDAPDDPIVLVAGDLIVDYFKDENDNKMPIILSVQRQRGLPWGKHIVSKKVELAINFSNQPTEIQDKIQEWLESV